LDHKRSKCSTDLKNYFASAHFLLSTILLQGLSLARKSVLAK
jgi:hypothetical protein